MSGVPVNPACVTEWTALKLKKKDINYIIYKVEKEREIVIEEAGKVAYDDFKAKFDTSTCRYAVVEAPTNRKLVFIMWTPGSAPVKERMIYASSRQGLLDKLGGVSKSIQATGHSEIAKEALV
ncbi:cofilin [Gregarina niphandrodes]|uniref:Cofilin n=1 Tax=Gregarina niphandrodes TaxID=110365 RepID=A0A023B8Q5_GRENI|nr:cofilin [Gregarina niphandrodes]EZG70158.1 cofilin [Gregarina niphandrodes]|eukprot:XP_011129977.1 cofilin [Gregarina niphandrodes]